MWKMLAKERIQTRIVAASAVKRVLDFRHQLSVCPATHLKMFRQKINIHIYGYKAYYAAYYAACSIQHTMQHTMLQSFLITEMW